MFQPPERFRREAAREYASRALLENIVAMNLTPGQVISEKEIADALGVSRTPVREAFIELTHAAIVEIYPQRGTAISLIDPELIEEARFLRCALETAVIQVVCEQRTEQDIHGLEENLHTYAFMNSRKDFSRMLQLDDEFHELLFLACNKERTYRLTRGMMTHFDRVRLLNLTEMDTNRTLNDHQAILEAVRGRDAATARDAMHEHLNRVLGDLSYLKQHHPEYFK